MFKINWVCIVFYAINIRTPALEAIRGLIERVTVLDDPAGITLDLEGAVTAMIDLAQPLAREVDRSSVKVVAGVGFEPTTFRL
jgi:site-specific DNA recombinase